MHKSLLEYIDVVAEETSPTSIILAVAELMRKEADASRETAKTSIFVFLDKLQNAGLPIDYTGLKAYYDADPRLSNVIQQFNDREIEFVGQGDEDEAPDTGAPVGDIPPEEKVSKMAKDALAKRESIGEDEYAALDSLTNNLNLSTEEYAMIASNQYEDNDELMAKLMDHFSDEMPYGTQKGRDGDPYEFIFQELDSMGLIKEGLGEAKGSDELQQAANAAIAMFERSGNGGAIIPSENFDGFNDNEAMAGIRYWGNWDNPQDAYDEEDYDQQDPTDETYENATKLIAKISKQFPNIEFELMIEEKNTMIVSAKHKVKESTEISESINDIIYLSGIKK
mgnify:FL=1